MTQMDGFPDRGFCLVCGRPGKNLCWKHWRSFIYDPRFKVIRAKRPKDSAGQKEAYQALKGWVKHPVIQEVIFPWGMGAKLVGYRYDIVCPDLKLIVEYDGAQHDHYVKHFHGNKAGYLASKARDKAKEQLAGANGWQLIRIHHQDPRGVLIIRDWLDAQPLKKST